MIAYTINGLLVRIYQPSPQGPVSIRILRMTNEFQPHLNKCVWKEETIQPDDVPERLASAHKFCLDNRP